MHFMVQGGAHADQGVKLRDGRPMGLGCCCDDRGMGALGRVTPTLARPTPSKPAVRTAPPKKKITAGKARAATKAAIKAGVTARAPAPPAASPITDPAIDQTNYAATNAVEDLYGDAPPLAIASVPTLTSAAGDVAPVKQARSVTPKKKITPAKARAATKQQLTKGQRMRAAGIDVPTKGQRLRAAGQNIPTLGQKLRAAMQAGHQGAPPPAAVLEQPSQSPADMVPADQEGVFYEDQSFADRDAGTGVPVDVVDQFTTGPGDGSTADYDGDDGEFDDYGGGDGEFDDYADAGDIDEYGDDGNLYAGADADADLYGENDFDPQAFADDADGYDLEDPTDIDGGEHLSGFPDDANCRLDQMGIRRCPREEALLAGGAGTPVVEAGDVSASGPISLWGGNRDDELVGDSFRTLSGLGLIDQAASAEASISSAVAAAAGGSGATDQAMTSADTGGVSLWGGNGDDVIYETSFDTLNGLGLLGASNIGEKISSISGKAGAVGDIVSRIEALFKGKQKVETAAAKVKQHAPAIASTALVIGGVGLGLYLLSRGKSRGRRRR